MLESANKWKTNKLQNERKYTIKHSSLMGNFVKEGGQ